MLCAIARVNHLHFEIDDGVIVHKNPGIQDEGFVRDMFSKDDFIFDDYGLDILHLHMKKRGNQPFENPIIFLKESTEKIVIDELDID